jgi:hypothetical protein
MRAKAGDDIRQSEPIAESASDIDRVIRIFFGKSGKLGPVQTAGGPLIKCGCREIFSYPRHFDNKTGKLLAQLKKSAKKFQSGVLNLLLPSVHGYAIPQFPFL